MSYHSSSLNHQFLIIWCVCVCVCRELTSKFSFQLSFSAFGDEWSSLITHLQSGLIVLRNARQHACHKMTVTAPRSEPTSPTISPLWAGLSLRLPVMCSNRNIIILQVSRQFGFYLSYVRLCLQFFFKANLKTKWLLNGRNFSSSRYFYSFSPHNEAHLVSKQTITTCTLWVTPTPHPAEV